MKTYRLAILLSGSGSTAEAIIKTSRAGKLAGVKPVVVISNLKDAPGLTRAGNLGVDTRVVERKGKTMMQFGLDILNILKQYDAQLVSQNGWLPLTPPGVIKAYKGKIINQHPGPLDPGKDDFGGPGMYGKRVTAARLVYAWMTAGGNWTESTVHHVTDEFDKGRVIRIETLPFPSKLLPMSLGQLQRHTAEFADAVNALAALLLPIEHANVIAVLQAYGRAGRFPSFQRKKALVPESHHALLMQAKEYAIQVFPNG